MKRLTKLATLVAALGLTVGSVSLARPADEAKEAKPREVEIAPELGLEPVDSFTVLTHPHSWSAIDDDTVIVWATPFKPYLVELAFPSHDLRFAHAIGVTSFGSRVYAKFDAIKVRGFRYPIEGIYKLTREEARELARRS
jgi:Family of unknown function (DUF6491)